MPLARARLVPVAAARFHPLHPSIRIEIVEGSHRELIERLRDGNLDFLIGALRFPDPGPDVEQKPLFEDRLMVVSGSRHPLAGTVEPGLAALASFPWVMAREGSPLRREWEALFRNAGMTPPPAPVTCGSVTAIRTLLVESDFLTLLSPEQVRVEIASGLLVGIGRPIETSRRAIGVTTRAGWQPTPAQSAFLTVLDSCVEEARLQEKQ
jgi:DNA-binding transcriptional LysR family regulator